MRSTTRGVACFAILSLFWLHSEAEASLLGDFDGSGSVGLTDYTAMVNANGQAGSFDEWRDSFGTVDSTPLILSSLNSTGSPGPQADVVGIIDGDFIRWTTFFIPDESLFVDSSSGRGGALAVGFSYEMPAGTLIPSSVMLQPAFAFDDQFPGFDPYVGNAVVNGIQTYDSVPSVLSTGSVDAIFLPAGGDFFTTGGPKTAMTFTTTRLGDTVTYGGDIAQIDVITLPAQVAVAIPEPTSISLVIFGIGCAAFALRR